MTQQEKQTKQQELNERLLKLQSVMTESDAHAVKCYKLGLEFAQEYPTEYESYKSAREEYNQVEADLANLANVEVEVETEEVEQ